MKKNKKRDARNSTEEPGARPEDADRSAEAELDADASPTADMEETGKDDADASSAGDELGRMQDRYLRLAAEYDNYRKRTERERSESWMRAQADLVGRLLDPLDDLSRVTGNDGKEAGAEAVIEGVRLVERKLLRTLEDAGLEPVAADGTPFDPEVHEALMTVPAEDPEEDDIVADVFQPGYRFKGVLLRPARVRVKKFEE